MAPILTPTGADANAATLASALTPSLDAGEAGVVGLEPRRDGRHEIGSVADRLLSR